MTLEESNLQVAMDERDVIAKEVARLSSHLMKLNDVISFHRVRLERANLNVFMTIDDEQESGKVGSKTLVGTV